MSMETNLIIKFHKLIDSTYKTGRGRRRIVSTFGFFILTSLLVGIVAKSSSIFVAFGIFMILFFMSRIYYEVFKRVELYNKIKADIEREYRERTNRTINEAIRRSNIKYVTPRQALGVSNKAEWPEIRSAYRKLAKQYHPDTSDTPDKDKFTLITKAYDMLDKELNKK